MSEVPYDFGKQKEEWSAPPIAGKNWRTEELLKLDDYDFAHFVAHALIHSVPTDGCQDDLLFWKFKESRGKVVCDFGCGGGIDAVRYALGGSSVYLADINWSNLAVAWRALSVFGKQPVGFFLLDEHATQLDNMVFDVFHANGVLHHTPHAKEILDRAWSSTRPGGEARLLLYSEYAWAHFIGTPPPTDPKADPRWPKFVRTMDAVGDYAMFYTLEDVNSLAGEKWEIAEARYIRLDMAYIQVRLKRRP